MSTVQKSECTRRRGGDVGGWPSEWAAPAFVAVFFALTVSSMRQKAAFMDEYVRIPPGYSYLKRFDFRYNAQHPPLGKMLSAFPLLFLNVRFPDAAWRSGRQWKFGFWFLYAQNDADRILFWGRVPSVLAGCLIGLLMGRWAGSIAGPRAGMWALFFAATSPTLLSQSRIASTDIFFTLFGLSTLYFFSRVLERWRAAEAARLCAAWTASCVTKLAAALLGPICVVWAAVGAASARGHAATLLGRPTGVLKRAALALVLALAAAYVGIWGIYGFRFRGVRDPSADYELPFEQAIRSAGGTSKWLYALWQRRLFPEPYLIAAAAGARLRTRKQNPHAAIAFARSFLLKTPVPALAALVVSLILWPSMTGAARRASGLLALGGGMYFAFVAMTGIEGGHQYLLPAYPLWYTFVACVLPRRLTGRVSRVLAAALLIWQGMSAAAIYPHYFSYCNELCGGPNEGWNYLSKSDFDEGQDLKLLKQALDKRGIHHVKLIYYGNADPGYYGISFMPLPPYVPVFRRGVRISNNPGGYYAMNASALRGALGDNDILRYFRAQKPIFKVGYTFFVFKVAARKNERKP